MLIRSTRFALGRISFDSVRSLHCSAINFQPRNFRKEAASVDAAQSDFDTVAEIESNLFEASSKKSVKAEFNPARDYVVPKSAPFKEPKKDKPPKREIVPSPTLKDAELGLSYKKLSLNDPLLNKLMMTAKSKKARDKKQQMVIEGRRLIQDAIAAGVHVEAVLFAQKTHLIDLKEEMKKCKGTEIFRIPQQDLRSWSTLVSCPGVIAICRKPSVEDIEMAAAARQTLPITVICDNIREPNNLGSIIRTCAAIPCHEVLVTKGCCDPWDTKALRGGCGAQFNVAIHDDLTWDAVEKRLTPSEDEAPPLVYIAESNTKISRTFKVNSVAYDEIDFVTPVHKLTLVIGGETHGVSEDAYRLLIKCNSTNGHSAGGCLHVPLSPYVESLNTASAITLILFEIRRKLQQWIIHSRKVKSSAN